MSAAASLPTDTLLALLRPQRLTAVVDIAEHNAVVPDAVDLFMNSVRATGAA
jgi:hypothetical protein